ncbi:MAG TPA: hypothetical protein VLE97_01705 [Gaiellaceae bacterium]|nr:hypothetical protein [Gaiellaceae bacterium]
MSEHVDRMQSQLATPHVASLIAAIAAAGLDAAGAKPTVAADLVDYANVLRIVFDVILPRTPEAGAHVAFVFRFTSVKQLLATKPEYVDWIVRHSIENEYYWRNQPTVYTDDLSPTESRKQCP